MFTVAKYKQCNLNKVIIVLYEQTSTLRSIQLAAQLNFYCPLMKWKNMVFFNNWGSSLVLPWTWISLYMFCII